ncbi:MAG TPA: hypothetical protein VEZ40_04725, partial [Pyrinomonadaceae bacterium]|nr:hypothetical protein [Pyrinomonadaceae bacterium]
MSIVPLPVRFLKIYYNICYSGGEVEGDSRAPGGSGGGTKLMNREWPENLPVAQVRVARPTGCLRELKKFYCEGIGLEVISSFTGHAGYSGL